MQITDAVKIKFLRISKYAKIMLECTDFGNAVVIKTKCKKVFFFVFCFFFKSNGIEWKHEQHSKHV